MERQDHEFTSGLAYTRVFRGHGLCCGPLPAVGQRTTRATAALSFRLSCRDGCWPLPYVCLLPPCGETAPGAEGCTADGHLCHPAWSVLPQRCFLSVTSQQPAYGQAQVPSLLPLHVDGAVTASMPRGGVRDQRFYVGLGLPASFKFFSQRTRLRSGVESRSPQLLELRECFPVSSRSTE